MQLGPSELSRLFSGSPLQFCFLRSSMFRYVPVRFPTFRYVPVLYSTFTFRYAPLRSGLFWAFPPTIPPSTFRYVPGCFGLFPYNSAFYVPGCSGFSSLQFWATFRRPRLAAYEIITHSGGAGVGRYSSIVGAAGCQSGEGLERYRSG